MKLIFERSTPGHGSDYLPKSDVEKAPRPEKFLRKAKWMLPEVAEVEAARHYKELADQTFGVVSGFYPLGSCTMKYNPRLNERVASFPGFTNIHPLQPKDTVKGCQAVIDLADEMLCAVTGMDKMTMQPAAGAHGEFLGLLLMKAYFDHHGQTQRTKMLVPDAAHGTNPASAVMVGFDVVNIPSDANGCVDIEALKSALGDDTAGLMLTNPNTLGLFDPQILEITSLVHEAGGLCYYDGANLNAIMGQVRPGDMGFDVIHLNLHKTFSTPHGGGGPGSGAVGCKDILKPYLPSSFLGKDDRPEHSVGQVRSFYGNFGVVVRALTYMLTLGAEGMREASQTAVLNANYLMHLLKDVFPVAYDHICMHEFVLTLEDIKKETGISALDVAKGLLDFGMHPPTKYFPLIVPEALMLEPTETESRQSLIDAAEKYKLVKEKIYSAPDELRNAPLTTYIGRPDEVKAARNPILRYEE